MSLKERIRSLMQRKRRDQKQGGDLISAQRQDKGKVIETCEQRIFRLMVRIEEGKSRSKTEFPCEIRQRIIIGNYAFASDQQFLNHNDIGLVLSCMTVPPLKLYQNIKYESISLKDEQGQNLLQYGQKVFELIEGHLAQQSSKVYIHCFHGKSRSVAVALLYLIPKEGKSASELLKDISAKYGKARPNSWFMRQLNQYHNCNALIPQEQVTKGNPSKESEVSQIQTQEASDLIGLNQNALYQQHLLIPENEGKGQPKTKQLYHLVEIEEDQDQRKNEPQTVELI